MCYEIDERNDLIIKYLPLVKKVVGRIEALDSQYDQDDLFSIGVMGLMDAINKYDHTKGVPFGAYASLRIKGSVMDELRKSGRVSRDRIAKLNRYYGARENLEKKLMRTPEESEICQELGIGAKELYELHETSHYLSHVSLDSVVFTKDGNDIQLMDMIKDDKTISPEEQFDENETRKILLKAISLLKERERIILNLYYVEELTLKEIAYIMDISVARVSQIHGRILMKLRELITPMLEDN